MTRMTEMTEKAAALPGKASAATIDRMLDLIYLGIVSSQPTWILSGSLILSLLA